MSDFLVDTSVWINLMRGDSVVRNKLQELLSQGHSLSLCEPIAMELLAGSKHHNQTEVSSIVNGLPSWPLNANTDFRQAGNLYRQMRTSGITVRSIMDCLIAVVAQNHQDVILLHDDSDYEKIAEFTELQVQRATK